MERFLCEILKPLSDGWSLCKYFTQLDQQSEQGSEGLFCDISHISLRSSYKDLVEQTQQTWDNASTVAATFGKL